METACKGVPLCECLYLLLNTLNGSSTFQAYFRCTNIFRKVQRCVQFVIEFHPIFLRNLCISTAHLCPNRTNTTNQSFIFRTGNLTGFMIFHQIRKLYKICTFSPYIAVQILIELLLFCICKIRRWNWKLTGIL